MSTKQRAFSWKFHSQFVFQLSSKRIQPAFVVDSLTSSAAPTLEFAESRVWSLGSWLWVLLFKFNANSMGDQIGRRQRIELAISNPTGLGNQKRGVDAVQSHSHSPIIIKCKASVIKSQSFQGYPHTHNPIIIRLPATLIMNWYL